MAMSRTVGGSIEETREYHLRYLRAVNNPVRRRILEALKEGERSFEDLLSTTGLEERNLKWHLEILENGFCVEKSEREGKVYYNLTKEGKVIEYIER
ncbi:winged helix-turn-helix transcriptional regulator [Candidatus Bathyarchaeota archaeon]|nr:winged helix-turn-helix transcriptional regulator [Candidatus Bathyarchaeota archaeon]